MVVPCANRALLAPSSSQLRVLCTVFCPNKTRLTITFQKQVWCVHQQGSVSQWLWHTLAFVFSRLMPHYMKVTVFLTDGKQLVREHPESTVVQYECNIGWRVRVMKLLFVLGRCVSLVSAGTSAVRAYARVVFLSLSRQMPGQWLDWFTSALFQIPFHFIHQSSYRSTLQYWTNRRCRMSASDNHVHFPAVTVIRRTCNYVTVRRILCVGGQNENGISAPGLLNTEGFRLSVRVSFLKCWLNPKLT
jgi:hypothetical protein